MSKTPIGSKFHCIILMVDCQIWNVETYEIPALQENELKSCRFSQSQIPHAASLGFAEAVLW